MWRRAPLDPGSGAADSWSHAVTQQLLTGSQRRYRRCIVSAHLRISPPPLLRLYTRMPQDPGTATTAKSDNPSVNGCGCSDLFPLCFFVRQDRATGGHGIGLIRGFAKRPDCDAGQVRGAAVPGPLVNVTHPAVPPSREPSVVPRPTGFCTELNATRRLPGVSSLWQGSGIACPKGLATEVCTYERGRGRGRERERERGRERSRSDIWARCSARQGP